MEIIGAVLLAAVFAWAAFGHIAKHGQMVAYTESVSPGPLKRLAYLGGWPSAIYLGVTAVGLTFLTTWGLLMAIAFMAVAQLLFHRNPEDPGTLKHLSFIGALLVILALV